MINGQFGPAEQLERIHNAAHYVGHAGAMVANLHLAGRGDKAEVWHAEQVAWQKRLDALLGATMLTRTVNVDTRQVTYESYVANEVTHIRVDA